MKKQLVDEIILHVGLHKTATSSIQSSLSDIRNRPLLAGKKCLYPTKWPINHSIPVYSAFCDKPEKYHINVRNELSREQLRELNNNYLCNLKKEVISNSPDKLIISGEDISLLNIQNLYNFKAFLLSSFNPNTIKVVLYVRDPVTLSISKMQEDIKSGMHTLETSFHFDLNTKPHSIKKRIEDVEEVFGKEHTKVYTFEKMLAHNHGPVGHFLSMIGFDEDEIIKFHFVKTNESLALLAGDIISFINNKFPIFKNGAINEPRKNGDTYHVTRLKGKKFDIPWQMKKVLQERYHNEIFWLKEHFGIDYSAPIEKKSIEPTKNISSEELTQLKAIYAQSSDVIQKLILEYLTAEEGTKDLFNELPDFVFDLEKISNQNLNRTSAEKRFRSTLRIDDKVDSAEIYREIALLLESHGEIETALVLMNKAHQFRPEGPFICDKIKEYLSRI